MWFLVRPWLAIASGVSRSWARKPVREVDGIVYLYLHFVPIVYANGNQKEELKHFFDNILDLTEIIPMGLLSLRKNNLK